MCNLDKGGIWAKMTNANSKRKVAIMKRFANTQKELIDRLRLALNVDSYNKLGKKLGIPYQTLARADKNENFLTDYYIMFMCDMADLDPVQTLACIRKEEAKLKGKTEVYEMWDKLHKKQAKAA